MMLGMSTTGQRLAQAMDEQGWTQSDLAREVGVTQGAISKIIKGETSNSRLLPKLAVRLKVSLPWLLTQTDDRSVDASDLAFSDEDREWLNVLHRLQKRDRYAVLQLARTLAGDPSCPESDGTIPILQQDRLEYRGQE